ncbi:MAG: hypothetical protein GY754_04270 [bacterium]|nr:hypothetical protein [bacterium]
MIQIIGLTGSFGSGCTFIAEKKIVKHGYKYISLSNILRDEYKKEHGQASDENRDLLQNYGNKIREELDNDIKDLITVKEQQMSISKLFKEKFKNLDYCRSLHAEENAILNIARFGSSAALSDATIYTTTYPCNLCANKIVQVGIKKVVYLEPYPMPEAKKILEKNNITQESFEGVLFNGYFRFKGE